MNLSISTLGCPGLTLDEVITLYKKIGVKNIEVRGLGGEMLPEAIHEFSVTYARETKRKLSIAGMQLVGFGSSVSFHDSGKFSAMLNAGKNAIDVCARMGIPWIRVFGNSIPKNSGISERNAIIDRVVYGINELCSFGYERDISVLLETHGDFITAETLGRVIDGAGDNDNFGILWDIAHTDRAYGDDIDEVYDTIIDYVQHVHIKDHKRNPDSTFTLVETGKGDIKIKDIVEKLSMDGYEGCFSFEWEKKWHPELADCETAFPHYVEFMKNIQNEIV